MPTKPLTTRYKQDLQLFPDRWHKVGLLLAIPLALLFPYFADAEWMTIGNTGLIFVVGAVGMMVLTGFAGQISLGHAAFLALGAYTAAVLGKIPGGPPDIMGEPSMHTHWPFWAIIPTAGVVAAAVGLAIGPFALRLKGLYLAIVTLGLLFLVEHVIKAAPDLTGGVGGTSVPMWTDFGTLKADPYALGDFWDDLELFGVTLKFEHKIYFVFLLIAIIATWCAKNLKRSNTGRAMMAVRDHDIAAAVLGVNPAAQKIIAFGVSSFFAGVAGAMYGFLHQTISIQPPGFDLNMSVQYIAMIVLGGIGSVFGAVWGAIAFVALAPLAETLAKDLPLLSELTSTQQSTLLFALVVILFLVFEPLGLFGIWLRIKRYFMAWPFRY